MTTVRHLTSTADGKPPIAVPTGPTDADRVVWLNDQPAQAGPEAGLLRRWAGQTRRGRGDVAAGLRLARDLGRVVPPPGAGDTSTLWSVLATLAAGDLTIARVVEPHLDALAIMAQLDTPPDLSGIGANEDSTWGVFAAEGPGQRLQAHQSGGRWALDGVKPWCSLAANLSHAIVTAWVPSGARRTFAVALDAIGVEVASVPWHARGLPAVVSGPVTFRGVTAVPIGLDDWYLNRPGFAWGGMGVAACWYGGAVGVARELVAQARTRELDQIGLMHVGAVDQALVAARCVLLDAAARVDDARATGTAGAVTALRVRAQVATTVEQILIRSGHALGPAPLCFSDEHASRVADLQVYVRQEHAERDAAALGRVLLTTDNTNDTSNTDDVTDGRDVRDVRIGGWPW